MMNETEKNLSVAEPEELPAEVEKFFEEVRENSGKVAEELVENATERLTGLYGGGYECLRLINSMGDASTELIFRRKDDPCLVFRVRHDEEGERDNYVRRLAVNTLCAQISEAVPGAVVSADLLEQEDVQITEPCLLKDYVRLLPGYGMDDCSAHVIVDIIVEKSCINSDTEKALEQVLIDTDAVCGMKSAAVIWQVEKEAASKAAEYLQRVDVLTEAQIMELSPVSRITYIVDHGELIRREE